MTRCYHSSRFYFILFYFMPLWASLFTATLYAQERQRIEFAAEYHIENPDKFQLVPLKAQGFLLIAESEKQKGKWIFSAYDTCLKKMSEKSIQINPKLFFQAKQKDGENIYMLFSKYRSDIFQVVQFNTYTHQIDLHTITAFKKFYFTGFRVLKNACFVSGLVGQTSLILHFNLKDKKTKVLPASLTKHLEVDSIEKDSLNQLVYFTIVSDKRTDYDLLLKSFSVDGELVDDLKIRNKGENKLISGKISTLENGKKVAIGTYSDGTSSLAEGIYIAGFQSNNTQEYIKYYPFTEFKNFFDYLPKEQQKRIDKLKEKHKELKSKDIRLQYRLLVHSPVQRDKDILLLAEAYFPMYRNTPKIDWQGRREGVTSEIVFEGYQHTHAVVMSFDDKGKMLWDNVFKIEHVKNKELQKIIHLRLGKDSLTMLYGAEGFIRSKMIQNQKVTDSKDKVKIPTISTEDKINKTYSNEISYWYEKHFLAWGYQLIENEKEEKHKRRVFYVAKVRF